MGFYENYQYYVSGITVLHVWNVVIDERQGMTIGLQKGPWMIARHAAGWALFIFYEMASVFIITGQWGKPADILLYYGLNICLFYLHARVVLPRTFGKSKYQWLKVVFFILAELAIYLIIKAFIDTMRGYPLPLHQPQALRKYVFVNAWRGVWFLGCASVYWTVLRMLRYRLLMAESEKQLGEVRYAYLQQQISPHFLFNTLNFVYSSVFKYSSTAANCILQLTDLLRYSLSRQDPAARTTFAAEMEQVMRLIAINRMRHDFDLFIEVVMPENMLDDEIIPLILLTFTENIFKHGNLKDRAKPAKIVLVIMADGSISFHTWNLKKGKGGPARTGGTGIANAIKRLDYSCGERYQLKISEDEQSFNLELILSACI